MENLKSSFTLQWLWLFIWLFIASLYLSQLAGVHFSDAQKYLNIAQYMWHHHQYLVPHFNGHPYSDKPPLMFWLFALGWQITGVNQWWPQLLVLAFATGSLFSVRYLAFVLWPEKPEIKLLVPYILLGFYKWILFTKFVRVDSLLIFFTIWGYIGLARALQNKNHGWWIYAVSMGLALMCKGPAVFPFLLFPAFLLPFISNNNLYSKATWYRRLVLFTAIGLGIVLLWAISAGIYGGHQYFRELFFGQLSHRMKYHNESHLYYLINLPIQLLPWLLFYPVWRGIMQSRTPQQATRYGMQMASKFPPHPTSPPGGEEDKEPAASRGVLLRNQASLHSEKFCFIIIIIGIGVFSFFGQKHSGYTTPLYPLYALLIAHALSIAADNAASYRWSLFPFGILLIFIAAVMYFSPSLMPHLSPRFISIFNNFQKMSYLIQHSASLIKYLAVAVFASGVFLAFYKGKTLIHQTIALMLPVALLTPILYLIYMHVGLQMHILY